MKGPEHRATLPHLPGLDGLRALSVLFVMVYHAEVPWLPGGFLALDVFFVVSGYLITSLIRKEVDGRHTVDIWEFWKRRARRLLPALGAVIASTIAYAGAFHADELGQLRAETAAALTYSTNWFLILTKRSYFDELGRPSALRHLWSLAVEEQFYIVWPLLFGFIATRARHPWPAIVLGLSALGSACLMASLFAPHEDPSRVYYGSDTRAQSLLWGATLACLLPPERLAKGATPAWTRAADALGLTGLIGMSIASATVHEEDAFPYFFGFAAIDLAAVAMLLAATLPGTRPCRALFTSRPMRWVGQRSYSLYLWHWPVLTFSRPHLDVPFSGPLLLAAQFGLSFALAEGCFRWVEAPVRGGALGRLLSHLGGGAGRQARTRARRACVLLGLACAAVVGLLVGADPPRSLGDDYGLTDAARIAGKPTAPTLAVQPAAPSSNAPIAHVAQAPSQERHVPQGPGPAARLDRAATVLCLGDSVMLGAAKALRAALGDVEIDARVGRRASEAIRLLSERRTRGMLPASVVVHIGNNGWLSDAEFQAMAEQLRDVPRVFFLTNHVMRRWREPNNTAIARGAEGRSQFHVLDFSTLSEGQARWFRKDGCHLTKDGALAYAELVRGGLKP